MHPLTIEFSLSQFILFVTGTWIGYLIMVVSATVYFYNRKSPVNRYFSIYALLVSIWTLIGSFNLSFMIWPAHSVLLQMVVTSFLGTVFLFFGKAAVNENYKPTGYDLLWLVPPIAFLLISVAILSFPEQFAAFSDSLIIENFTFYYSPGATFYFHSVILLLGHFAGGYVVWRANRNEVSTQYRKRNRIILAAVFSGVIGGFVLNNIFILLHRPAPVVYSLPVLCVAILIAGYSILSTKAWKLEDFFENIERDRSLLRKQVQEIKRISCMDPLTEIYNRYKLYEELDNAISRFERYGEPVSIILFDIDHFKDINDRHGHLAGDEALVELAGIVQSILRKNDLLVRWGGEEFIVVMPHTRLDGAVDLAMKIQECIAGHAFAKIERLHCSFGVCQHEVSFLQKDLLLRADNALYKAKASGRNCICAYAGSSGYNVLASGMETGMKTGYIAG